MNARDALLPRLVAHLRAGGEFSLTRHAPQGPTWSAVRLRIRDEGGRPTLQVMVEAVVAPRRRTTSAWTPCDWSVADLLDLSHEAEEPGVVTTGVDAVEPGVDAIVDAIISLLEGHEVVLAGRPCVLDDDCVSTLRDGMLVRPEAGLEPASAWLIPCPPETPQA